MRVCMSGVGTRPVWQGPHEACTEICSSFCARVDTVEAACTWICFSATVRAACRRCERAIAVRCQCVTAVGACPIAASVSPLRVCRRCERVATASASPLRAREAARTDLVAISIL